MMTRVKNGWPSLCHICSSMVVALDVAFEIFLSLSVSVSLYLYLCLCVSVSVSNVPLSVSVSLSVSHCHCLCLSVCLSLSLPSARHIPINSTGSPPNAISLAPTPRHFQWWKRDDNGLSL